MQFIAPTRNWLAHGKLLSPSKGKELDSLETGSPLFLLARSVRLSNISMTKIYSGMTDAYYFTGKVLNGRFVLSTNSYVCQAICIDVCDGMVAYAENSTFPFLLKNPFFFLLVGVCLLISDQGIPMGSVANSFRKG